MRLESIDAGANALADRPHQFREMICARNHVIIVPSVSSETRRYFPVGLLPPNSVVTNLAFGIYDGPEYILAILSSRLHTIWTAAVGGQLETRLRYSNTLVYNTFPIPELSAAREAALEDHAADILGAREAHPGKTIAWLYNPETMPPNLLKAHRDLDETLETLYIGRTFRNDTERLEHLFRRYSAMSGKRELQSPAKELVAV